MTKELKVGDKVKYQGHEMEREILDINEKGEVKLWGMYEYVDLDKCTVDNIKPQHYKLKIKDLDCEAKDVIIAVIGTEGYKYFCIGNAIKYILRAERKNGLEDYKKNKKYLEEIINLIENQ